VPRWLPLALLVLGVMIAAALAVIAVSTVVLASHA
jgi:hypothetical protein